MVFGGFVPVGSFSPPGGRISQDGLVTKNPTDSSGLNTERGCDMGAELAVINRSQGRYLFRKVVSFEVYG